MFYLNLLRRLGPKRFSFLLGLCMIVFDACLQFFLNDYFEEIISLTDIFSSLLLGFIFTPLAAYFFTVILDNMVEAQTKLNNTVSKLEEIQIADKNRNIELEREIKERQKSEQKVKEGAFLLKSFLNSTPDLVFHRDLEGLFVNCNTAMEELLGVSEDQMVGMTPFDVFEEEIAVKVLQRDKEIKEARVGQLHEHWLTYPNGVKVLFEVHSFPLFNSDDECIGIIGFAQDITEQNKHAELLEKKSRDKTTFISTISHELRTPLNGIVGLSNILLDGKLTKAQRSHLKTIHMSAITLGNIFNDIIDLDKLDRKRLQVVNQVINLNDFLFDIENLSSIQTDQKGLVLSIDIADNLPKFIESDDTRLRQILWNLISNAVKFTNKGEIKIRCFCVYQEDKKAMLTFDVEDCGIGIPKDQLDKIFTMYYQVKSKYSPTGTGIGLSVSANITAAMKGSLTVKSELNKGSTFSLSIPVTYCDKIEQEEIQQRPLSILLVEDIPLNTLVAKALLEKHGHSVDCAETGEEALQKVVENQYEFILMDIQLPDMTGYEVTARLREIHGKNLPPIVALTANVFSDKSYFLENGLDAALGKPLNSKALSKVINSLFGDRKEEQAVVENEEKEPVVKMFNIQMQTELLEFLPTSVMLSNVALFEKVMPDYLNAIDRNRMAKDKDSLLSEAHKVKSAASSIGLLRLQKLADKIQSPSLPAWESNLDDWIELMKVEYKNDIQELKKWIVKNGK
ncbi:MAG TPA: aerobic respiration two-component sensor histidine kinase ArcB [Psychromonas hadalis]|nr:aerobic respiration two-component sensor histidine kinase ArcB [Psychromonas hadalis]